MNGPRSDDVVAPAPRSPLGHLICAARVRCAHRKLDAQLAAGRSPWSSSGLTRRAAVLASLEERRRIAGSIVGLVRLAEFGRSASPYLRVRRAAVLDHRDALLGLAARLHAEEPVEVATVAQLALLVRDEGSPVFEGGRPVDQVTSIIRRCARASGGDFCASP